MMPSTTPVHELGVVRLCLRFVRLALQRWRPLLGVLATMLLSVGLNVLKPWPMKVLVDNVLSGKKLESWLAGAFELLPGAATPENLLTWAVGAGVAVFVLGWAVELATSYANIGFGQRLVYDLAGRLFDHLQRLSLRFHTRHGVGDSIRRITSDSECVSTIVKDALLPVATSLVSLVTMFLIMWQLDASLTLLSLTVVPLMVVSLHRYSKPMLESSYEQNQAEGRLYDTVEQKLSAMPVVQAFSLEEDGERRIQVDTDAIVDATVAATNVQFRFKILTGLATALGTAGILWIGARHAIDGQLTVGEILVFLSYLDSLYGPLESLMYTGSTIQQAAGSARRVLEVLDAPPEVADQPGAVPLPPVKGHVRIEEVSFSYEKDYPVLRGVSLEARPGQVVAIVGATGAGKSTLVSLVPRFFDPEEGRVSIDGHDLRSVQLKSLRRQVSLVLQESFLFPISIAENIAYGRPEASREEIEAAARAANAHTFIEALPEGYDTVVGERGATLSGGERQRIAIARALLKDAPVLILDEPTSALDAETERLLLEALDRLMAGRTTLIIAHRLSTIRGADTIVVLEDGAVVESGSHSELVAADGVYANLHRIQVGTALATPEPTGDGREAVPVGAWRAGFLSALAGWASQKWPSLRVLARAARA